MTEFTTRRRKKKSKAPVFIVIAMLMIIAIVLLFSRSIYDHFNRQWLLRTHQLEFTEQVEKYAREYDLDKFLLYAVIKTESSFNPSAVSNAGARGLMQIMEDTFNWIYNYRLFESDLDFDDMFNPDDNVRYGSYLIRYHLNNYNGDVRCAMAAYFVGDQWVNAWLEDSRYSKNGTTLDVIPDSETNHYVNKIMTAYDTYIMLYGGQ